MFTSKKQQTLIIVLLIYAVFTLILYAIFLFSGNENVDLFNKVLMFFTTGAVTPTITYLISQTLSERSSFYIPSEPDRQKTFLESKAIKTDDVKTTTSEKQELSSNINIDRYR